MRRYVFKLKISGGKRIPCKRIVTQNRFPSGISVVLHLLITMGSWRVKIITHLKRLVLFAILMSKPQALMHCVRILCGRPTQRHRRKMKDRF